VRLYRTLCTLLLVAEGTIAARAHAQPAPAAPDAPRSVDAAAGERARKLLAEGARLFDEGKFSEAYVAFLAAWAVQPSASLAKNLADCETKLGKHRDAAEHLRYIAKSGDAKPEDQRRAKRDLAEALKRIGVLRVTVSIDGAAVSLDGDPLGPSPLLGELYVAPGKHVLEARHDRYDPVRAELETQAGSSQIYRLQMTPSQLPPEATTAFDRARPWVIRGGLALTVIGIAVGAGTTVAANNEGKQAAMLRTQLGDKPVCAMATTGMTATYCAELKSAGSTQSMLANASVGMFIVGGVAALATAGLWTFTVATRGVPSLEPLLGARVVPVIDAHQGGVALVGRF